MFGRTPEDINYQSRFIPEFIRKRLFKLTIRLTVGRMEDYGLPRPDHSPTESHPLLNSQLLYHLRHGDVHPRPGVVRFSGDKVVFTDGREEEYDVVIAGTGYKIQFPFLEYPELDFSDGRPVDLYLKLFHPDFPTFAVVGLFQPQGCIWPISELQAKLVASHIKGSYQLPSDIVKRVEKEVTTTRKKYLHTPRHSTEVDFHSFMKRLQKELKSVKKL